MTPHESLKSQLLSLSQTVEHCPTLIPKGKVTRIIGMKIEAAGLKSSIGSKCRISLSKRYSIIAEVVGFADNRIFLMGTDNIQGLKPGAIVTPLHDYADIKVGDDLLGRVIDGGGIPLDGLPPPTLEQSYPSLTITKNPLQRPVIDSPLDIGVRSINSLLTLGRGQRIGLFAGSGVGKSVLLSMMTRFTQADVIVVALIGERGREVKEFIEQTLTDENRKRAVIIAAPADTAPLMRLHGATRATTIAEYFRDKGNNVLLLMDSLTRFAQAQRELSLSLGEPPTHKGYAPSVFSKLSQLTERAGTCESNNGSITAIYTVLVEGDDLQDPIADAARAILDGHIVLSRTLADSGHYPAIDIEKSVSRVMNQIITPKHRELVKYFKRYYSYYLQNQDMIKLGAYQADTDQVLEHAIKLYPKLNEFMEQDWQTAVTFEASKQALHALFTQDDNTEVKV